MRHARTFFCQVSGKVRWDFDTQAGQTTSAKTITTTTATTYEIEVRNGVLRMWQNGMAFETVTPSTVGNSFTAAGKRFYLVQRDSKYDEQVHTIIFLR